MKRLSIAALSILALMIWIAAASGASTINISVQNLSSPTDPDIPVGEVPGYIKYSVAANSAELQELLKLIAQDKFNSNTDGTFLVTLALTAQGKTIAERTLMQGAIKSSSFLWFTNSSQTLFGVNVGDQLAYGMTVDEPSNLFQVQLRAYKTDKVDYDPKPSWTMPQSSRRFWRSRKLPLERWVRSMTSPPKFSQRPIRRITH
jgi:hypothetical protein